ncbi:MAG: thioredoxin family protein [Candidatus Woesearchaeota archaeon]
MHILRNLRDAGLAGILLVAMPAMATGTEMEQPKYSKTTHLTYTNQKPVELNKNNFKAEVLESKVLVMVDFYSPNCGACIDAKPYVEAYAEEYKGRMKVGAYNVRKDHTIPNMYNIEYVPTFIFYHNGKEVDRIVGFDDDNALRKKIEQVLKRIK